MLGMSYLQQEKLRVILTRFCRVYDFADVKDWDQNKRELFIEPQNSEGIKLIDPSRSNQKLKNGLVRCCSEHERTYHS